VEYVTRNKRLDFGNDPDDDADSGIIKRIFPLWDRRSAKKFANKSRSNDEFL